MLKTLLKTILFFLTLTTFGQSNNCLFEETLLESKEFDINQDGFQDLVELINCSDNKVLNLRIKIYFHSNKSKTKILNKEIISNGLEGYARPELIVSSNLIKIKMFVDKRFSPGGTQSIGEKTVEYFRFINNDWTYFGSISTDYNEEGNVEEIRLTEASLLGSFYNTNQEIFKDVSIQNQYKDSLESYITRLSFRERINNFSSINKLNGLEIMYLLNFLPINLNNLQKYNDIGYFLVEAKKYTEAVYILQNIIEIFPSRTVAYINIGDAYFGSSMKSKAQASYNTYITLMKKSGKETKIPKRVYDRVKAL